MDDGSYGYVQAESVPKGIKCWGPGEPACPVNKCMGPFVDDVTLWFIQNKILVICLSLLLFVLVAACIYLIFRKCSHKCKKNKI